MRPKGGVLCPVKSNPYITFYSLDFVLEKNI